MTFSKIPLLATLVAGTLLAACGRNDLDLELVRNGPQAVHPSPSALAATRLYDDDATPAPVAD